MPPGTHTHSLPQHHAARPSATSTAGWLTGLDAGGGGASSSGSSRKAFVALRTALQQARERHQDLQVCCYYYYWGSLVRGWCMVDARPGYQRRRTAVAKAQAIAHLIRRSQCTASCEKGSSMGAPVCCHAVCARAGRAVRRAAPRTRSAACRAPCRAGGPAGGTARQAGDVFSHWWLRAAGCQSLSVRACWPNTNVWPCTQCGSNAGPAAHSPDPWVNERSHDVACVLPSSSVYLSVCW